MDTSTNIIMDADPLIIKEGNTYVTAKTLDVERQAELMKVFLRAKLTKEARQSKYDLLIILIFSVILRTTWVI